MNIAGVIIAGSNIGLCGKHRAIAAGAVSAQRLMVGSASELEPRGGGEGV